MRDNSLNSTIYDLSVDRSLIEKGDILNTRESMMKKNNTK